MDSWERMSSLCQQLASSKEVGQEFKQGRNLEVRAATEVMGNAIYWLGPYGLFSLLSYSTQDDQPRDSTTSNGLVPPPSIAN